MLENKYTRYDLVFFFCPNEYLLGQRPYLIIYSPCIFILKLINRDKTPLAARQESLSFNLFPPHIRDIQNTRKRKKRKANNNDYNNND